MGGAQSGIEQLQNFPCVTGDELNHNFSQSIDINVGIDESLLRYSGVDSTAKLEAYSFDLLTQVRDKSPVYLDTVGSALVGAGPVKTAVGIGALAISMVLQMCFVKTKGSPSKGSNPEDLLRRVFAEEKSSQVRVLMDEYLKRYRANIRQDKTLLEETIRLEKALSLQITTVKDSMFNEHMNSKAFKHWTNGAAFHAQMLIHIARLKKKAGHSDFEDAKFSASSIIQTYNRDLDELMKMFRTNKLSNIKALLEAYINWYALCCEFKKCCESNACKVKNPADLPNHFIDYIFSTNPQIIQLKSYFSDLHKNLNVLTAQQGTFQIPKRRN